MVSKGIWEKQKEWPVNLGQGTESPWVKILAAKTVKEGTLEKEIPNRDFF